MKAASNRIVHNTPRHLHKSREPLIKMSDLFGTFSEPGSLAQGDKYYKRQAGKFLFVLLLLSRANTNMRSCLCGLVGEH